MSNPGRWYAAPITRTSTSEREFPDTNPENQQLFDGLKLDVDLVELLMHFPAEAVDLMAHHADRFVEVAGDVLNGGGEVVCGDGFGHRGWGKDGQCSKLVKSVKAAGDR